MKRLFVLPIAVLIHVVALGSTAQADDRFEPICIPHPIAYGAYCPISVSVPPSEEDYEPLVHHFAAYVWGVAASAAEFVTDEDAIRTYIESQIGFIDRAPEETAKLIEYLLSDDDGPR